MGRLGRAVSVGRFWLVGTELSDRMIGNLCNM